MDVTCERCGTEYDFDETLVSDRGTTVKCTNCGHLFKVFKPGAQASSSTATGAQPWLVRRRDGGSESLTSLRELQKRIAEGALSPDDEISRSGDGWKKLGDIAELHTFFEAARAAARGRQEAADAPFARSPSSAPGPRRDPRGDAPTVPMQMGSDGRPVEPPRAPPPSKARTLQGVGAPASTPPPPADKKTLYGMGGAPAADTAAPPRRASERPPASVPAPAPAAPAPSRRGIPATAEYDTHGAADTVPEGDAQQTRGSKARRVLDSEPPPSRSSQPRALYVDEDDAIAPPRRRSGTGLWVGLVVVLALGGGVALGWPRIAPLLGFAGDDPTTPFLARGDAALAKDDDDGFAEAEREYTKALAFRERDAHVLASLSRVHAAWAQALDFDADDLEARAPTDPTASGMASRVRDDQRRHAADARRYGEDAVRVSPADAAAEVALADALRLGGDGPGARSHIDRATTMMQRHPTADALLVGALVAMDEAGGQVAAARPLAEQAVQADGTLLRARMVLGRALLASGDVAGARAQVEAVLARESRHPRALALRDAIDQGLPPAQPVIAVPDAGVGVDLGAPTVVAAPGEVPVVPAETAQGGGSEGGHGGGDAIPSGQDYGWYVDRADQAIERGDVGRARALYEAALRVRQGPEALSGLGYVALNSSDFSGAVARFRPAADMGYGGAIIGLAEALRGGGHPAEALAQYERYLERLPNGPESRMARTWVERLRESTPAPQAPPPEAPPPPPEPPAAPPPSANDLPAPRGTDTPPPQTDGLAIGNE